VTNLTTQELLDREKPFLEPVMEGYKPFVGTSIGDLSIANIGMQKFGVENPRFSTSSFGKAFEGETSTDQNLYSSFAQSEGLVLDRAPGVKEASTRQEEINFSTPTQFNEMIDRGMVTDPDGLGTARSGDRLINPFDKRENSFNHEQWYREQFKRKQLNPGVYMPAGDIGYNQAAEQITSLETDRYNYARDNLVDPSVANFFMGLGGVNPYLIPKFTEAKEVDWIDKQKTVYDENNTVMYIEVPIDEKLKNNKTFKKFRFQTMDTYNELMSSKDISTMEMANTMIDKGVIYNADKGTKLVPLNIDSLDPEIYEMNMGMAADVDASYGGGQAAQLAIEFIPVIGMFDNVARAGFKLIGKGGKLITGSFDDIKTGQLSKGEMKKLIDEGVSKKDIKKIQNNAVLYAKANPKKFIKKNIVKESNKVNANMDAAIAEVRKEIAETGEILSEKEIIELATKRITFGIKADKAGKELVDMFGKKSTDYGLEKDAKYAFRDKDASKVRNMSNLLPTTKNLTTPLVDGSKSYSENLTDIAQQLEGKMVHGSKPGESLQPFSSESEYFRQAVQKEYFKQNQLSVKEYEDYYKALINDKGRVDLPKNFYAGLKREEFPAGLSGFKAYDNTRRQIPNLKQARKNLEEQGYSKKDFKNAAQNQKIYSYSPEDYAAYRAKQAGYRSTNYSGSKQEARVLGLKDYGIKLSEREQSIFDQVNFVWKTDTSVAIKNNKNLQNSILENENIINNLSYRVLNSGKLAKSSPNVTKTRLKNTEFNEKSYTQTFYETDHIMPVELANTSGVNALRNLQTLPKTLNNDFKKPFDRYVAKLLKQKSIDQKDIDNIREIVDQAKKLNVTLYIDEPAKFGYNNKLVGAPYNQLATEVGQIPYVMQTENIIKQYSPGADLRNINLNTGNAMGGIPIERKKFAIGEPGTNKKIFSLDPEVMADRFVSSGQRSNDPLSIAVEQEQFDAERELIDLEQLERDAQDFLSSKKPLEFRFTELLNPKKMLENPLIRKGINANFYGGGVYLMELAETIANGFKTDQGEVDRIQFEEYFPQMHKAYEQMIAPLPETPEEQTYISAIDELNRGMDRGLVNLSYDIMDIATMGLDLGGSAFDKDVGFQKALKKSFEEMDKSEPETFLGKIATIATEFGVPAGTAYKLVNRFRKLLGGAFGVNLFAESTLGLKGTKYASTVISNISKAAGTNALAFGMTDIVAGGPYNSVNEYFGDNPLLFDGPLNYELEDTSKLTGKDLALANFRNRLRFGADGAIIGGMFPLIGAAFKFGAVPVVKEIGAPVLGIGLTLADELAIKPVSYLAAGKLKAPFSKAGNLEVDVPLMGEAFSGIGSGVKIFSDFLGSDVISRLAANVTTPEMFGKAFATSITGSTKGGSKQFEKSMKDKFKGELPSYEDWRLFEVTSDNALEVGLKRFDNFLAYFRDSARQSSDRFRISGETDRFIKARTAQVEDLLRMIEVRAHDLATGFLKRSNQNTTSPAGEQAMLEQVLDYIKGNVKINQLDEALQGPAKQLGKVLDEIKVSFRDILPDDNDLKALLNSNLKQYIRQSFAVFNNPKYNIIEAALEDTTKVGGRLVNAQEKEIYENALSFIMKQIQKNESLLEVAKSNPGGIKAQAQQHLKEIMMKTRIEGRDPLDIMSNIARENLFLDDLVIRTGEELPEAIRKFLGEQRGLRDSVVTTTASLLTQASNMRMYKRMLDDGLENGWIFKSREEARAAGILNPQRIASKTDGRMSGITGELNPEITKYFASPDIAHSIGQSQGGLFDSLYQNFVVQNLIAYKAGVQTMKTVFSPATQARNFGSAAFFPLNMGHIGGNASVTDAFKMVMDDIFGAGRVADEEQLIKYLTRQKELGVIDENIVVSELQAVLQDIKAGQLKTIGGLAERINKSELVKGATKLYAGGDNVWKLYGSEFVKSQLRDVGFRSVAEVGEYMRKMFGVNIDEISAMTGRAKTVKQAIEEAAAYTIRETYPTYSKVPDLVKFFRRVPFIGNFVSFPAEILRTSMATTGYALKHIADDNPMLRQMGYRTLMGQATAVGGAGAVFSGLGHTYTGITEGQVRNYQKNFAPDFMKYSQLMPIAKIPKKNSKGQIIKRKVKDESGNFVYDKNGNIVKEPIYVDGQFKVFDLSRYLPYDLVSSVARSLLNTYSGPKRETLDPSMVDDLVLKSFFNTAGPLYDLAGGTFFGTSIGFEPLLPLITKGKDKNGKTIFTNQDRLSTKIDKFMAHWFNTVEPGGFSSAQKVFNALQGDVQKGSGVPLVLKDELFKLFGGSTVTVDLPSSLRYKIADFKDTFPASRATENYFSTQDYMNRGPEWLVASYNQQNREAFAEQYEFYKAVRAAQGRNNLPEKRIEAERIANLPDDEREDRFKGKSKGRIFVLLQNDDRLMQDDVIQEVLINRLGETRAMGIMEGYFTPLSTGEKGLTTRMNEIYRNNPKVEKVYDYDYFMPIGELETLKSEWSVKTFEEYEKAYMEEQQKRLDERRKNQTAVETPQVNQTAQAAPPVAPLPASGAVQVAETQPATGPVNEATGLTGNETALLNRDEQLIRQRQRGIV